MSEKTYAKRRLRRGLAVGLLSMLATGACFSAALDSAPAHSPAQFSVTGVVEAESPDWLQVDLGEWRTIEGLRYLPPLTSVADRLTGRFEIYVSDSQASWGDPVGTVQLDGTSAAKEVAFDRKRGRYVRFDALSEIGGIPWIRAEDLEVSEYVAPVSRLRVGAADAGDLEWHTEFSTPYLSPVILLGVPTDYDPDPGVAKATMVSPEGFDLGFAEWAYLPGDHTAERIDWLALEAGRHDLDDGVIIEAGTFEATGDWTTIKFSETFPGTPALLLSVQSDNGSAPVAVRAKRVNSKKFKVRLYREEGSTASGSPRETVGYLALYLPTGSTDIEGLPVQRSRVKLTDKKREVLGHTLWLQEEGSKDSETKHSSETVEIIRISGGMFAQNVSTRGEVAAVRLGGDELTVVLDGLRVTDKTESSVSLAWNPVSGPHASLVVAYQVLKDGVADTTTYASAFQAIDLQADTPYRFQIQALGEFGAVLAESNEVQVRTDAAAQPPGAPVDLSATDVSWASVTLSWAAPPQGAGYYKIYRDGVLQASSFATSYTDSSSGLVAKTGYDYFVTAVLNDLESVTGAQIRVTTTQAPDDEPPQAPTRLHVEDLGRTNVTLGWVAAEDNRGVAGYRVLRDGQQVGETTGLSFTDSELAEATGYSYTAVAFDIAGNQSAPSAAISVTTLDRSAPSAPGSLSAEAIGDAVHLTWAASGDNVGVIGYRVLRDGGVIATTAELGFVDTGAVIGVEHGYQVLAFDAAGNESGLTEPQVAEIEPLPVAATTLAETCMGCHGTDGQGTGPSMPTLAGMDAGYFQTVMADFANGTRHSTMMGRIAGGYSPDEIGLMAEYFAARAFTPADQLVNLEKADRGATIHRESCAQCHGESGADFGNGTLAGQWMPYLSATLADFTDGLSSGVPGTMLNALDGLEPTDREDLVHYYGSQGSDTQAPPAPTDLAVADVTEYSITLTWMDGDDNWAISHYEIWRDGQLVGTTDLNAFTDTGLDSGELYGYRIVAVDRVGNRSEPSVTLVERTAGEPAVSNPDVDSGHALWNANGCGGCHGAPESFTAGADVDILIDAIVTNRGGMSAYSHLRAQDLADISAYLADAQSGGGSAGSTTIEGVTLLNNEQTLRKASILLAGRLPTAAEYEQAQDEEGLRAALRAMMTGWRFGLFAEETGMRRFLTGGALLDDEPLREDFPNLQAILDVPDNRLFRDTLNDVRREPLALLRYIAENDVPYTEILTADYTMVSPRTAQIYEADLLAPFPPEDPSGDVWVPATVPAISARTDLLAATPYPHAGVLTMPAWLSRFPTTDTNRNRHRSKMLHLQFLGVDIEALGQRPIDDSANDDYLVPTMENPNCTLCHIPMDPVAGAFMNWGTDYQYWQNGGGDSLAADYKSASYPFDHYDEPWYRLPEKWYRDVFAPGFEGKDMPGERNGFDQPGLSGIALVRDGWSVLEASSYWYSNAKYAPEKAIDGDLATSWQTHDPNDVNTDVSMPQHIVIDMGAVQELAGLIYVPRTNGKPWHVGSYEVQLSDDATSWSTLYAGEFTKRDTGHRTIRFPQASGRYLRVNILSDVDERGYITMAELYALKPVPDMAPHTENHNGGSDSLQWLAREVVQDSRFAKGAVLFWYEGLFGRPPLAAPVDPSVPGYADVLAAYQVQDDILDAVAARWRDGGYLVRDLLVELIMTDLFRATGAADTMDAARQAALADVGAGRLLGPTELDAKGAATIGRAFFSNPFSGLGLVYGGFDGGRDAVDRNTEITPMMLSAVESRVYTQLCDNRLVRSQLNLPAGERYLIFADDSVTPYPVSVEPPASDAHVVERAIWTGITGSSLDKLESIGSYPYAPNEVSYLDALDAPSGWGDNYGQRLRTLLRPPTDGDFTFWVSGDDWSSLRLSSDTDPANAVEIAGVPGHTRQYEWTKYAEQQSAPVSLKAGQAYYLEVVQKEGGGGDHVSVAWGAPGAQQVITSADLWAWPVSVPETAAIDLIKWNIRHLHAHLLGEELALDDPEIERTFALFKEVYENEAPEDSGLEVYCETRNLSTPSRRAWSAVLAYLMTDFRYLSE